MTRHGFFLLTFNSVFRIFNSSKSEFLSNLAENRIGQPGSNLREDHHDYAEDKADDAPNEPQVSY